MPYTIVVADDHPFTAEGIGATLREIPNCEVVACVGNGIEAIAAIKRLTPDCALLDLSMPGATGMEVFIEAKRWSPSTRFAIITGMSAPSLFVQLREAGIDGLFLKNAPPEEVVNGIAAILRGETMISAEVQAIIGDMHDATHLSPRELEVLLGLSRGQNNRQIADTLNISPKTVDTHRTNLLRKMEVTSTAALLVSAMRRGLIDV